jgi:hypothetical protein
MDKGHILREIRRIAVKNADKVPGRQVFERETGIKMSDWYPHIWLRWGDALAEAGYVPNQLQTRTGDDEVILKYVSLVRELGTIPVEGEIRRKGKHDKSFPSHTVFKRFGGKEKFLNAVVTYCLDHVGFEDVAITARREHRSGSEGIGEDKPRVTTGFVYLMKSGRHYKIGRTKSVGRRSGELAIKIPVPPKTIHSIQTDDPIGIESYWHRRFSDKRGEGEWFKLSAEDVRAFKRWKRIV